MNPLDPSATRWRKSSRSTDTGGECVEVAASTSGVAIRDSKNPNGPVLLFTATEWRTFTRRLARE